jgi:hypothetical protein
MRYGPAGRKVPSGVPALDARMSTRLGVTDLVRAVKMRAVQENKKLKDAFAELLRRGLAQEHGPKLVIRRRLKLPLVESPFACNMSAIPPEERGQHIAAIEAVFEPPILLDDRMPTLAPDP